MTLLAFIKAELATGRVPISYKRKKIVTGTEAEFRWKRYRNSQHIYTKVDYHVTDEEHALCEKLVPS